MKKTSVCILFGGMAGDDGHSLRAAQSVLRHIDREKYHPLPVGITDDGDWILFADHDHTELPEGQWQENPLNAHVEISPIRGRGLLRFEEDCVVREQVDVVFPLLYGQNGQEGSVQGLLQLAGIPCVGSGIGAVAVCADRERMKLVLADAAIPQPAWQAVHRGEVAHHLEKILVHLEKRIDYPVSVVTACGKEYRKAENRAQLSDAMPELAETNEKLLVEAYTDGRLIAVAVMGNGNPVASVCGEKDPDEGLSETAAVHIPARISEETEEQIRELAVKAYTAVGCRGLALLEFCVAKDDGRILFHNMTTMPDFAGISMYQILFAASGIPYEQLLDELLKLAMEDQE